MSICLSFHDGLHLGGWLVTGIKIEHPVIPQRLNESFRFIWQSFCSDGWQGRALVAMLPIMLAMTMQNIQSSLPSGAPVLATCSCTQLEPHPLLLFVSSDNLSKLLFTFSFGDLGGGAVLGQLAWNISCIVAPVRNWQPPMATKRERKSYQPKQDK